VRYAKTIVAQVGGRVIRRNLHRRFPLKVATRLENFLSAAFVKISRQGILVPATVGGNRIMVSLPDNLNLFLFGVHEPYETEVLLERIHSGDVALDIGANVGYYSLLMSNGVGASGRVYAFEPDARNFDLLRRNTKNLSNHNVLPMRVAVGARVGEANLLLSDENLGDHRVEGSNRTGSLDARQVIKVDLTTVDEALSSEEREVNIVKMDVEGYEPAVLRGMRRTISRSTRLTLISEFWPRGMVAAGFQPRDFLEELDSQGFRVREIDPVRRSIMELEATVLLRRLTKRGFTNLLCERFR
jgi:FkbM family methyltransferase